MKIIYASDSDIYEKKLKKIIFCVLYLCNMFDHLLSIIRISTWIFLITDKIDADVDDDVDDVCRVEYFHDIEFNLTLDV